MRTGIMVPIGRVGTGLLWLGGVLLALLMGYTLLNEFRVGSRSVPDDAQVAVFYPSQSSWLDFRQAAEFCVAHGLAEVADTSHDALVLRTRRHHRRVRFTWHGAQGQTETAHTLHGLLQQSRPPQAVIGSSNSVLTAVLAEALASHAHDPGPVLLIPDATAVRFTPPGSTEPLDLMTIHRGRTFRLGLDNRRLAELAVRYLADRDGPDTPACAFLVVDRNDSYSSDLAESFTAALMRMTPQVTIPRDEEILDLTGLANAPSARERTWATQIWRAVAAAAPGQKVVVLLPLQAEPARRLLLALEGYAPSTSSADGTALRVILGDGLGPESLAQFAGPLSFPVWSTSSGAIAAPGAPAALDQGDALIPAEAISALLACLDEDRPPADLAAALHGLRLAADDPRAMGRLLAFDSDGERRGDGLGHVLGIEPGETAVFAHVVGPDGRWHDFARQNDRWRESALGVESSWLPVASRP